MIGIPLSLKGKGEGMATSTFYLKGDGWPIIPLLQREMKMDTSPFSLKRSGWPPIPSFWKEDGAGHLSILSGNYLKRDGEAIIS